MREKSRATTITFWEFLLDTCYFPRFMSYTPLNESSADRLLGVRHYGAPCPSINKLAPVAEDPKFAILADIDKAFHGLEASTTDRLSRGSSVNFCCRSDSLAFLGGQFYGTQSSQTICYR